MSYSNFLETFIFGFCAFLLLLLFWLELTDYLGVSKKSWLLEISCLGFWRFMWALSAGLWALELFLLLAVRLLCLLLLDLLLFVVRLLSLLLFDLLLLAVRLLSLLLWDLLLFWLLLLFLLFEVFYFSKGFSSFCSGVLLMDYTLAILMIMFYFAWRSRLEFWSSADFLDYSVLFSSDRYFIALLSSFLVFTLAESMHGLADAEFFISSWSYLVLYFITGLAEVLLRFDLQSTSESLLFLR